MLQAQITAASETAFPTGTTQWLTKQQSIFRQDEIIIWSARNDKICQVWISLSNAHPAYSLFYRLLYSCIVVAVDVDIRTIAAGVKWRHGDVHTCAGDVHTCAVRTTGDMEAISNQSLCVIQSKMLFCRHILSLLQCNFFNYSILKRSHMCWIKRRSL